MSRSKVKGATALKDIDEIKKLVEKQSTTRLNSVIRAVYEYIKSRKSHGYVVGPQAIQDLGLQQWDYYTAVRILRETGIVSQIERVRSDEGFRIKYEVQLDDIKDIFESSIGPVETKDTAKVEKVQEETLNDVCENTIEQLEIPGIGKLLLNPKGTDHTMETIEHLEQLIDNALDVILRTRTLEIELQKAQAIIKAEKEYRQEIQRKLDAMRYRLYGAIASRD
jgi:hypothetical protein